MLAIIPAKAKLVLAISGGPDSVFLLHQLLKKGWHPHLAHLNHRTRGGASDLDEKFVQDLAGKYNLEITSRKIPKNIKPTEQNWRRFRYKFLEQVRRQTKSDYIVTAHHQDDQVETIMHNFCRGTGPQGLTGIQPVQGKILHPLLDTSKAQILSYLNQHQIKFCVDDTNAQIDHTRNYIRNQLLPQIKKINKNPAKAILQLSKIIGTQQDFIKATATATLRTTNYELRTFKRLHPAIQNEVVKLMLEPHVPANKQLSYKIIVEVRDILLYSKGGSKKILFNTLSIGKKNDKIYVHKLP